MRLLSNQTLRPTTRDLLAPTGQLTCTGVKRTMVRGSCLSTNALRWIRQSLAARATLGLGTLVLLLLATAGYAAWSLSVNHSSYQLIRSVTQLEISLRALHRRAVNYDRTAPRTYPDYERDLLVYNRHLQDDLRQIESTIEELSASSLQPDVPGESSLRRERESLIDDWREFRTGLEEQLGQDEEEPRLEWGAEFIVAKAEPLIEAADHLASTIREILDARRKRMYQLGAWGGLAALVAAATMLSWFYFGVLQRIQHTVRACRQASRGEFGYQVPVRGSDELSELTASFNQLSARLHGLFRLLDELQQGADTDATLRNVWRELKTMMPVDLLALINCTDNQPEVTLIGKQNGNDESLKHKNLTISCAELMQSLEAEELLYLTNLQMRDEPRARAVREICPEDAASFLFLPLSEEGRAPRILMAASRHADPFDEELVALLRNLAPIIGHAIDKSAYAENLLMAVISGLAKLAERRDPETGDHLLRMSLYSGIIADQLSGTSEWRDRINDRFTRDVERFAPMHDIGKVGIDDRILLKKGRLTDRERREMQRHTKIGAEVLRHCARQLGPDGERVFRVAIEIAESHHEKFDGSGYPYGLSGEDIPLSARIIAAADVFDALTSKRPYKQAWPAEDALRYMRQQAGSHFDPAVIDALESGMDRIMGIYERYKHI